MTQWPDRKWLCDEVIEAVNYTLRYYKDLGKDLPGQGHFEDRYCQAFSDYQGGGFTDAVNSGTSAIFVALSALSVKPNSIILSSPVTDFGTVSALMLKGAQIVLTDSKKLSYNACLEQIKEADLNGVSGLILTHSSGEPIEDIKEIAQFCKNNGFWLIEDCSQAHGASISGRKVGTFGDIAVFSTMFSKMHSTGGSGGLVYTRDRDLYDRIRSFSDRGKQFERVGFDSKNPEFILGPSLNFNSDEISCSIGLVNLAKLDSVIKSRQEFLKRLTEKILEQSLSYEISINIEQSSPYFCPILIKRSEEEARDIKNYLVKKNFSCNPHYSFIVSEWDWAKVNIAPHSKATKNAIEFRNRSFNLLFNEAFGEKELDLIVNLLKKAEESLD